MPGPIQRRHTALVPAQVSRLPRAWPERPVKTPARSKVTSSSDSFSALLSLPCALLHPPTPPHPPSPLPSPFSQISTDSIRPGRSSRLPTS